MLVQNVGVDLKMPWEKSGWLQTSSKRGNGVFIFASHDYKSTREDLGTVSVFFVPDTAFPFISNYGSCDEDMWSAAELIAAMKKERQGNFPHAMEEYVPVIASGETECTLGILEEYGLLDYKDDIEARLQDIVPFGYEEDVTL